MTEVGVMYVSCTALIFFLLLLVSYVHVTGDVQCRQTGKPVRTSSTSPTFSSLGRRGGAEMGSEGFPHYIHACA